MVEESRLLLKIEEESIKFSSIVDIPLNLCSLSEDSKEFLVYNVESNKICAKIPNPIPFELKFKGFMCKLSGSQHFYYGGCLKDDTPVGFCLLIDIKTLSVEFLNPGLPRYWASPIYYENFVYVFGGSTAKRSDQVISSKFNLRKNKWKRIADLPSKAEQTSTVVYENKILISGRKLGYVWKYDPEENSYERLLKTNKNPWKMFFVLNSRCYLVTTERVCYRSEANDWRHWQFYGKIKGCCWPLSNVCYYNKNFLYFDQHARLWQVDIKKLEIEKIATASEIHFLKSNLDQINRRWIFF
ncbi:unnamed protein product [Blepharisma stoltei]|uniref:Uncharacterized protein n=1 Tax=Blepharisma stoltei TaxID=1481888 RepID=A0AAU9JEU0_9CILI|nr:unnamed protein product [Blepharisma stoltei]